MILTTGMAVEGQSLTEYLGGPHLVSISSAR